MVHIRKVEIFGFKSFGFKNTTVDFEPGLVSISGPNGSGKSNILDAVIFALGENRPKVMRADKLRSLIHDIEGAGRHGPKMTRVSVHLDNSDRKIPVDSNTVTITREMDDKGENIYYLNQKKDKREHVLDLLEVANAGLNQLNAVQQGTVTRISEFSPEEKRQAIEDLIGLSFFDEKKLESENQLVESDRKLEVALAKMDEIKKRIDELEVERNRKLRHDALDREISRLRAISAAKDLKTIRTSKLSQERNLHAISSEIKKFEEERSSIRKEIHELNSQKSKFMEEVNAYNQAKSSIDSQISEALQKSEGANSKIITSKRRLEQIDTRLPQIKTDLEQLGQERSELEPKIEQLRQAIHTAKESQRSISEQVRIVDSELSGVLKEQSKISTRKIEADIKVRSLVERLNSAKLALFRLESEHKDIQSKFDKNTISIQNFKSEQSKMAGLAERLDVVISNHKATITELKSRISQLGTKRVKGEQDVDDLALILEKASKAAAQYETQIRTIKGIMHEDYSIAQLKEDANKLGIEGLVYEMFSWDENHERAILAVGSDWLKAVIVKDFATLISLAEVIRTRRLPRLKILPIDAIPPLRPSVPDDHEVIGILSDYIRCDDKFSAIRTFLFGNVLLVQSREAAHRLSEQGYKTVTIHGEYFEAKANAVVLDINSKISKITKIISLSSSIEGLSQSIHLLKKYLQKRKGSLKNIEDRLQDYKNRFAISDTGLTNATTQYSDLKARISQLVEFQNNCIRRNSQLEKRKEHLLAESAKQKSYIGSLEERISIVQDNYADTGQSRVASDIERLNERKLTLMPQQTDLVNMLRGKESDLASLSAAEEAAKSKTKTLHEDNSILTKEKHEHEVSVRALEKEKETSDAQLVALREKEQTLIATSGTSISQLNDFDDKLDDLNEKERTVSKEINTRERQSDSINRDLKDLVESETKLQKILSMYGFDESLEIFEVESILPYLEKEKNSLTASLNAIAPVKYIEVSEGYRSMSTRKNELQEERNSIVRFIEEIEKDKRQTFLNAFDTVDKEIQHAFSKMTGGNAWLEIQNEDDVFSSGLSYMIQFPNKPKRESTSISGGEKTLAAVVFVLALQKLKPSPFYLFDEVDAHLDAPNAEKLSRIIEERSKGSQFIMVSLKDSVVEKARLIYGVFPKNGVSNVVMYKDKRLPSMAS